jgi:hypothetical protein
MSVASIKAHFMNWRQWELNAVVVKELRQAVRSWAVTGMLLLFLSILFCTSLVMLVTQSFQVDINQRLGATMFQIFVAILAVSSLLFIPVYVGTRLAAERQESNMDLLYVSTLTPGQIIRGKFLCGVYTTLLFFSACMPFMAFTNLLRGVDLPTIFLILFYLFVFVCAAVQVAIFFACLPITRAFKVLIGLFGAIGGLSMGIPIVSMSWALMRVGIGATMGGRGFWTAVITSGSLLLAAWGLLYLLSVALISPLSANRARPLRIYITVVWIFGGLLSLIWVFQESEGRLILPWGVVTLILVAVTMIVLVSNHDQLSLRVRRDIPSQGGKRRIAFLFYNGAAGGLLWVAIVLGLTFVVTAAVLIWGGRIWGGTLSRNMSRGDADEFLVASLATVFYLFAYTLTGLFLHRKFCPKRSPKIAGLFVILIVAAVTFIPNVILFFANRFSLRSLQGLQPGSVFNVLMVRNGEEVAHLLIAAGWLLFALLLNRAWFFAQFRNFRPLDRSAPTTIEEPKAGPPPIPT